MKTWLVALFLLGILIVVAIPNFFSEPEVSIEMPKTASGDADVQVSVSASAWHYKFQVNQIDLETTASGGAPSPGVLLYKHPGGLVWWQTGRFFLPFWPTSEKLTVALPLRKLSHDGGVLRGRLTVTTVYRRPFATGWAFDNVKHPFDFEIGLTR
jgi:hypothetical protein